MGTIDFLKKGAVVKFRGELYIVSEYQHVKPGKGGAFVKTKLKNIKTGGTVDQTFHDTSGLEPARVDRNSLNFLYADDDFAHFMDQETYEQVAVSKDMIGDVMRFMKDGQKVVGVFSDGAVITVETPKKMTLKVTSAPDGAKGDTASGTAMKEVELETGATIQAPVFIKEGESIAVNTEDGTYSERVNS